MGKAAGNDYQENKKTMKQKWGKKFSGRSFLAMNGDYENNQWKAKVIYLFISLFTID